MSARKKSSSKSSRKTYDIVIVGGGLAGLSLSCLLGETTDLTIACLDRESVEHHLQNDSRTTAISYGSGQILERAGIWKALEPLGCPIRDIRILDGDTPVLLQFLSGEMQGRSFGWIFANRDLRTVMLKKIATLKNVNHIAPEQVTGFEPDEDQVNIDLRSGKTLNARLLVGADGRGSFVREALDIPVRGWDYGQRAVICNIAHEFPHENRAIENFWPEGPFALLPMNDDPQGRHLSALVFTEHGPKRRSLMRLSDEDFRREVADKCPASYGRIELACPRQCYPLSLIHAARYIGPRTALVADAAHGIHPVAGQGLNLGFRDIGELGALIQQAAEPGQDIGAPELLETYQRRRRPDNTAMIAVTDALVRLFSNNLPPVRLLRRLGLKAVAKLPPAKRFFMANAMGREE
ncbi:MAG: UbiH/UbiF/VisC/COQ6 family ubiquinone biosynthesis hydroxylase [Alphaproteobacteria bacterium]|nr:UbiH/UbiF/VisC/COQ6 family ubiquinone biosynthesis hydroxylase [Alphaproteobacteria bacterium]QQS57730.1 MAG: UbiH/UbiF/VisC/COQ6 family ubiquinone biosynthesis hydroxylase [Alphaproteobacteria bacterium]